MPTHRCFGLCLVVVLLNSGRSRLTEDRKFRAEFGSDTTSSGILIRSLTVSSCLRCAAACLREDACIGINYIGRLSPGLANCEMLAVSDRVSSQLDTTYYVKANKTEARVSTSDFVRTVVAIRRVETGLGQDLFIRGGNHTGHPIPITVSSLGDTSYFDKYNAWRVGDLELDWTTPPQSQGSYNGTLPLGTPTVKTTNISTEVGYNALNTFGSDYWLVDMMMSCPDDGWFELKAVVMNLDTNGGWEADIEQIQTCGGTAAGSKPYDVINHQARCGFVNVFRFEENDCQIYNFP